jgi:hypothetical protein
LAPLALGSFYGVPVFTVDLNFLQSTIILLLNFQTSSVMASALNVLQTSHAYGDVMLVSRAAEVTTVRTSEQRGYFVSAQTLIHNHIIYPIYFSNSNLTAQITWSKWNGLRM